ncbi:MAG: hypothetical protein H6713_04900 [Myxococcales bacterium]|nr:hypothetical protein [Myxococcales bacterium]MCB9749331.1 hypothetical protein [Myxococcales bacterium]
MSEFQLATRTSITAYYSRSQLLIIAEGKLPTPDWEIDISQDHNQAAVPTFRLSRRPRPTDTGDEETPFRYGEIFTIGRPPDHIIVRHVDGDDRVPVEFTNQELVDIVLSLSLEDSQSDVLEIPMLDDMGDEPSSSVYDSGLHRVEVNASSLGGGGDVMVGQAIPAMGGINLDPSQSGSGMLNDLSVRYRESVGYSNKLSFDEAFADALKKLPPPAMKFPDMMETVEVVHIGGTFGGIAGFHRLEVRIRAYPD